MMVVAPHTSVDPFPVALRKQPQYIMRMSNRLATSMLALLVAVPSLHSEGRDSRTPVPESPTNSTERWLPPGYKTETTLVGQTLTKVLEALKTKESAVLHYDFTPGQLTAVAFPVESDGRWLVLGFAPPPMDFARKWPAKNLEQHPIAWAYSREGKPKSHEIVLE